LSGINFKQIEEKWQKIWEENKIFESEPLKNKQKIFVTFPYPYMDGPLHVGHAFTSLRCEIYSRYKRLKGYNVLFPWSWHWTGEPIAGAAKRIAAGDEALIKMIHKTSRVSLEEIKKFTDPLYMAKYFTEVSRKTIKRLGYSIDWRREFHTTSYHKEYSSFIRWQYNKLKNLGYVSKGSHPVVWCPRDKSPTGDHDRLIGEGVSPEQINLVKFKFDDSYLVAATLRPETIFGVTNIWINPDDTYVKIKLGNEKWIVNEYTLIKLENQDYTFEVLERFKGEEIIGKYAEAPLVNRKVIILPAYFIDPFLGTGIVYSVPSHAPYDWIGLKFIKENKETIDKFNLNYEEIKKIEPISIIKLEGYGDHPAIFVVEKMQIKQYDDPKLEMASREVYLEEFNKGIMKENCFDFSGMKVKEAKEKVIQYLKNVGMLEQMWDLLYPVKCRCGTRCVVSIFKDQWFLKYSDNGWKEKALYALSKMKIFPEEARNWFIETIKWLDDKACARRSGLGTPLPWDERWIVETLSDSTIYMCFYIISKYVNQGLLSHDNLKDEFFDYVFLGLGNENEVEKICKVNKELLKKIREEFLYWYPVDLRVSAKELLPNHLTFYIFHHVALFPEELWPKMIGVNGLVNIEGQKLSKSKGIVVTIEEAIEKFGADVVRLFLALSAEDMNDCEWRWANVEKVQNHLISFFNFVSKIIEMENIQNETEMDNWLRSVFSRKVIKIEEFLEELKIRSAANLAFYEIWSDIKWYLSRVDQPNTIFLKNIIKDWLIILSIFIPHLCEELWKMMGNRGFISISSWPVIKPEYINIFEEAKEEMVIKMYEDAKRLIERKKETKNIYIYIPKKIKYSLIRDIDVEIKAGKKRKEIFDTLIKKYSELIKNRSLLAKTINELFEHYFGINETLRNAIDKAEEVDLKVAESLMKVFNKEGYSCKIFKETDENIYDPLKKMEIALPFKLGFYLS
jgi:leucyl-tRNA synthetase